MSNDVWGVFLVQGDPRGDETEILCYDSAQYTPFNNVPACYSVREVAEAVAQRFREDNRDQRYTVIKLR